MWLYLYEKNYISYIVKINSINHSASKRIQNIKIQENLNQAREQGIDSQMNEILSTNPQEGEKDAINEQI